MNAETKREVERLADIAFAKAEAQRALSMQNTPTDYNERKAQFKTFALATYEMIQARKALDRFLAADQPSEPEPVMLKPQAD